MRTPSFLPLLAAPFAIFAASCGGASFEFSMGGLSLEDAAVHLIETDIAEQVGVELDAECPPVEDPEVGAEFACTATTPTEEVIHFAGIIDREDHIDITSTNVIRSDRLELWEQSGAEVVGEMIGGVVTIDCGEELVVLPDSKEMACIGTDAAGETAPIIYRITDLDAGDYDIRIGE